MTFEWEDFKSLGMWVIVDRLADVILSYVEGCIVEIGMGVSTPMLAKLSKNFGVKHYAVDQSRGKCKRICADERVDGENFILNRSGHHSGLAIR